MTTFPSKLGPLRFDGGTLLLEGGRDGRPPGTYWKWDRRLEAWRCDAYQYPRLPDSMAHTHDDQVCDYMVSPKLVWKQRYQLRKHQTESIDAWMKERRGQIVLPTGAGKTLVALEIMQRLDVPSIVIVPTRDLLHQWADRIVEGFGFEPAILGDRLRGTAPVTVTTYDSAYIHMQHIGNRYRFAVWDECHHLPGKLRSDSARMTIADYRLGLTATPAEKPARAELMRELVGPIVYQIGIKDLAGGELAPYKVVLKKIELTPDEKRRYSSYGKRVQAYFADNEGSLNERQWKELCRDASTNPEARAVMKARRAQRRIIDFAQGKFDILEDIFRHHRHCGVMVFTNSNATAMEISRRFWIPCLLSHCGRAERQDIRDGFIGGAYRAIVANRIANEGIDFPSAKVGVILGGRSSKRDAEQRLGRIVRQWNNLPATLYEVVCKGTVEERISRERRRSDAY